MTDLPPVETDPITFPYISEIIAREDAVLLDIGANNGGASASFVNVMPGCRVFAFEPDPRAIEKFEKLTAGMEDRIHLTRVALGAEDGEAEFHMSGGLPPGFDEEKFKDGWDLSGSIRKPKNHLKAHPWCTFDKKMKVPLMRLDSWFAESGLSRIDFIWADVQGAEGDLIAGGRDTLAKTRFFYTEYDNRELYEGQLGLEQIMDLLPGFRVKRLFKNDVLLENTELDPA